ncbi:MAG: beta-galactosidase [Bacteroidota bacterium]
MIPFVIHKESRRFAVITFSTLFSIAGLLAQTNKTIGTIFSIDASAPIPPPETEYLQMGSIKAGISPTGHQLFVNSRYILLDKKPWLPVMGEFHYTRFPEKYWEEELLKMKAGGIQIVSTYIIWIHHEELEGQFEWSGQKNLRKFVELCAKHGLYVFPRIGPWSHAEVRNGGLPDWLLHACQTRVNDSLYLSYTQKFYHEIGKQLKRLLWKDGGPVIGIQLENEYSNRAPTGGAAHIIKLKNMAVGAGIDVPLYTITGWDNAVVPPHIVIPVFGGYPDEAWSGSKAELPPDPQHVYQFHLTPINSDVGIMQGASTSEEDVQLWHYPMCTAELGAGMQVTYHRRVRVSGEDIPPIALTALGSGVNLIGYYMYHGGSNPDGKRTTLQESQATGYPNDVPVVSYDFQAPLREYGQLNSSFRPLKVIHQFIKDFGSILAPMRAVLPDVMPSGQRDTTTLRVSARTSGNSGFLFVNNYLRNYPLPIQKGIQVKVMLPTETIMIPRKPVDILSQSCFFWPLNMDLNGSCLLYATAQPFTMIDDGTTVNYFFISSAGIAAEFIFVESTVKTLQSQTGRISHVDKLICVDGMCSSTTPAIELTTLSGKKVRVFLFSQQQACNSWKIPVNGKDYLLMTDADVFADGDKICLRSRDVNAFTFSLFPSAGIHSLSAVPVKRSGTDGVFSRYTSMVKEKKIFTSYEQIRKPQAVSPVKMGPFVDWRNCVVATTPDDSVFDKCGIWHVKVTKNEDADISEVFLNIGYTGDICRLYRGTRLVTDNFYNGTTWQIGLKRLTPDIFSKGVDLKILPIRSDAPLYLPKSCRPDFKGSTQIAGVDSISVIPEYEVKVTVGRK